MKVAAQPFSYLFFIASTINNGSLLRYVNKVNNLLTKQGNMLLLEKVSVYNNNYREGTKLLVVPLFFNFPFAFWPLYLLPRFVYSLAFMGNARKYGVSLWPCGGRKAAAIMEVYK